MTDPLDRIFPPEQCDPETTTENRLNYISSHISRRPARPDPILDEDEDTFDAYYRLLTGHEYT